MGRRMKELKQSANFVLTLVVFCAVAAAGFAYLYVKKPAFNVNIDVDVAIVGSSVCGLAALFFFFRSIRKRPKLQQKQEVPLSCSIGYVEPFGC